ncbi:MAG: tyrosine-type recombinase/integrase [Vulcanimicrobiaceae bacterium]
MFATKSDALAFLSITEADIHRGAWIDHRAGKISVKDYANEWLARRPDLAVRTAELYRYLLDSHILPELGTSSLAALAPSKVRGWHAKLAQAHSSTAAKAYRLLSTIMRTAVMDGFILASPCKVVGGGTEHAAERPIASLAEVEALTAAIPERLRLVVLLAMWCQLRRGELLGLRRRDLDALRRNVSIERSRTFTRKGASIVKGPKSSAGRRTLSIPANVLDAIDDHLTRFVAAEPNALVFTGKTGVPLTAGVLQKAWAATRKSVGRTDLHLHDLRHTGLTLAAATGATTAELMHRAGHASPNAALRYQHATRDRDRVLAEALAELAPPAKVVPIEAPKAKESRPNHAQAVSSD